MKSLYVYSTENDMYFVKHLTHVQKLYPSVNIFYKIGSEGNIDANRICSMDASNTSSVFIRSYSYVTQYNKIENTFYWVHPKYTVRYYDNKLIAMDDKIEQQLLKMIIPPLLCDNVFGNTKPCTEIKNVALCSCYEKIALK
jgi:hypothetical protein